jgi:hypothetical protein
MALVLAATTVVFVEPLADVVATAPVTARAMTKRRTISFILDTPFGLLRVGRSEKFLWTNQM